MNKAVAQAAEILPPGLDLGMGYVMPAGTSFDDWDRHLQMCFEMSHKTPFLIGDMMNAGEEAFGEEHAQAIDHTKVNPDTLRTYRWVCNAVPLSIRIDKLTFSHHRAVAGLDEDKQKELLAEAVKQGWTSKELRKAVRKLGAFSGGGAEDLDGDGAGEFDSSVKCPRCNGTGFVQSKSVVDVTPDATEEAA